MKAKRLAAMLLVLALLLCGCAPAEPQQTQAPTQAPVPETTQGTEDSLASFRTGKPWILSNMDGVVTDRVPAVLKDDFYLTVNNDFLVNGTLLEGYSSGGTIADINGNTEQELMALFDGGDPNDPAIAYYELQMDWETRNRVGLEPLKAKMAEIDAVTTIDQLNDYFCAVPVTRHPVCPFIADITIDPFVSGRYVACAEPCELVLDPGEYQQITDIAQGTINMYAELSQKMLVRLGYSQEEAQAITDHATEFEQQLAWHMYTDVEHTEKGFRDRTNNFFTREEMLELQGSLPIVRLVEESRGFGTRNLWLCTNPDYLRALNELYDQEHLDLLLDWLRSKTARYYCSVLDWESRDLYESVREAFNGTPKSDLAYTAMRMTRDKLPWYTAKLYCDTYFTQQDKDTIRAVVDEMIAAYRKMLMEEDFIQEQTKAAAVEKLEQMQIRCLYPDDWSLNLNPHISFKTKAQGGTLFEAFEQVSEAVVLWDKELVDLPVNRTKWSEAAVPTEVNACYIPSDNSINVYAAICRGGVYNPQMEQEEVLGCIGSIIGHELTHAFDGNGSQYDAQGNYRDWWTEEDKAAFEQRNEKLLDYLCSVELWEGTSLRGEFMTGECCADMGAVKCCLSIAEENPDFDYDLFFRSYANMWKAKKNVFAVMEDMTNPHPPYYLRVNAVLQQFDRFLDTYDIQPGDGMYLAPEDRVAIW